MRVGRPRMYGFPSLSTRSRPSCIVRGPTFPRAVPPRRSPPPPPPPRFFSSSPPPSIVFLPPSPLSFSSFSTLPSIHPLLSSGLNCCNLWPMPVDLTVELSHGDLYGLLILQRSSGGWNLAMGFHRFSTGQAQPLGGG